MALMDRALLAGVVSCALAAAGCRSSAPPEYPTYGPAPVTIELNAASANGFDAAALAAADAESLTQSIAKRTDFTVGQREAFVARLKDPLARLSVALQKPSEFKFSPRVLLKSAPRQEGFRLLGQALEWRIAESVRTGNLDSAVADLLTATRLGCLLVGGDTRDAAVGLWAIDRARAALAPALPNLGAGQLGRISQGVWAALAAKPLLATTYQNDERNALMTVDALQLAHRSKDLAEFRKVMSSDGPDAMGKLGRLDPNKEERKAYFDGLAAEVKQEREFLSKKCREPAAKRDFKKTAPKRSRLRPWIAVSRHFVVVGRGLLESHDATVARMRILAIECAALQAVKNSGKAPKDLGFVPKAMRQDPYSGMDLMYRAVDRDFKVYSVGANFTDEGGDTNAAYFEPDLRLERPLY